MILDFSKKNNFFEKICARLNEYNSCENVYKTYPYTGWYIL